MCGRDTQKAHICHRGATRVGHLRHELRPHSDHNLDLPLIFRAFLSLTAHLSDFLPCWSGRTLGHGRFAFNYDPHIMIAEQSITPCSFHEHA